VRGIEGAALSALTKVDRLLPPHLRARVGALRDATVRLSAPTDDVDAEILVALAQCCDANERAVVTYRNRDGHQTDRRLDPYRLVSTARRWYLLAWDVDRGDWRTFRVDRVVTARRSGHRFTPDPHPPDAATVVGESITTSPYRYKARVLFPLTTPAQLKKRVPPTVGTVRGDGTGRGSILSVGADDLNDMVAHLVAMNLDFEILEPEELREHAEVVRTRLARPR
jgi:predicted DNA-binding transcriptional regulator YafY